MLPPGCRHPNNAGDAIGVTVTELTANLGLSDAELKSVGSASIIRSRHGKKASG